jgi:hypothetical protein
MDHFMTKILESHIDQAKVWADYRKRQAQRKKKNLPTICILGPGGCGKDTAGIWFNQNTKLDFIGSNSWIMAPFIAKELGQGVEEAYNTRRENRQYWRDWINRIRVKDSAIVAAMAFSQADVAAGFRAIIELEAAKARGMIDLSIWIENPNVEPDPTLEIQARDCDIVVYNTASLKDFYQRLWKLASFRPDLIHQ